MSKLPANKLWKHDQEWGENKWQVGANRQACFRLGDIIVIEFKMDVPCGREHSGDNIE